MRTEIVALGVALSYAMGSECFASKTKPVKSFPTTVQVQARCRQEVAYSDPEVDCPKACTKKNNSIYEYKYRSTYWRVVNYEGGKYYQCTCDGLKKN